MSEEIRVITKDQYNEYMELKKQFADVSKTKRWKPKGGEIYHYIVSTGEIDYSFWATSAVDEERFNFANTFKTKEQAQKELDRRLAEQELLDMCDWEDEEQHYLVYDYDEDCFESECALFFAYSPYCFATEESAKKAINTLGTDKLKLIFRID